MTSKRLMITRLGNIQVGKGQYLYKTGRCIWRTKNKEPINRSGKSEHVHRLVKGEQRDKDNKRVVEEDQRINKSLRNEGDNTRLVWSPPLLSSTPLGTASGTSRDPRVDRLVLKGICMCGTFHGRMVQMMP